MRLLKFSKRRWNFLTEIASSQDFRLLKHEEHAHFISIMIFENNRFIKN